MTDEKFFKKAIVWVLFIIGFFVFLSFWALFARNLTFDSMENFPSWTSSHESVWTSWDSGFYYEIANSGYPVQKSMISTTQVTIPAGGWVKVFAGNLQVGKSRYSLPTGMARVSNVVFLMGSASAPVNVPLYSAYAGIPYCTYKGPIDFERDVAVHRDALQNPDACGGAPCDRVYVTYYNAVASEVMYQEYFDSSFFDRPMVTFGESRPYGFGGDYEGWGCGNVASADIKVQKSTTYEKEFTAYPFAFLYPYLARFVSLFVGDIVSAGVILSMLLTLTAAFFLYLLAGRYLSSRESFFVSMAYLVFPGAFFNFTFQPVSLLAALFFGTLYFGSKDKILLFGLTSLLLVLAGPYFLGILLLLPLFFMVREKRLTWFVGIFSVFMGIFVRIVWIFRFTGDFLAFFKAHAPWMGGTALPPVGFVNYIVALDVFKAFEIVVFVVFLVLAGWLLFHDREDYFGFDSPEGKLRPFLGSFFVAFGLLPLFNGGFAGILKFYFLLVPAFFSLGRIFERSRWGRWVLIPLFILVNTLFMCLWTISSRFVL